MKLCWYLYHRFMPKIVYYLFKLKTFSYFLIYQPYTQSGYPIIIVSFKTKPLQIFSIIIYMTKVTRTIVVLISFLIAVQTIHQQIRAPLTTVAEKLPVAQILIRTSPLNNYHGTVEVNVDKDDVQKVQFWISLSKQATCDAKLCFVGWVEKYTTKEDTQIKTHLGYPGGDDAVKPVFNLVYNSDSDYKITHAPNLNDAWAQIIQFACQTINPFDANTANKDYTMTQHKGQLHQALALSPNLVITNSEIKPVLSATLSKNLELSSFKTTKSTTNDNIVIDASQLIGKRLQTYDFDFVTDKRATVGTTTVEDADLADFAGNVKVDIELAPSSSIASAKITQVKGILTNLGATALVNTKASLVESRKAYFAKFDVNQVIGEKAPVIDAVQFQNQKFSNINIQQSLVQKVQIGTQLDLASEIIAQPNLQLTKAAATIGNINHLHRLNGVNHITHDQHINVQIDLSKVSHKGTVSQTLFNYQKVLFSKTIFGKTVQVSVQAVCTLAYTSPNHQITCYSKLFYVLFGNSKTIDVYSFTKTINSYWAWNKNWNGSWAFNIDIPLPPPVSFITVHFYFSVGYSIDLGLVTKIVTNNPFTYSVVGTVSTAVTTDARASIRLLVVEGGVFLKGTLVKVTTSPGVVLKYLFAVKQLNVAVDWKFSIIAFKYEWGFFWRYWTFWSGWSGVKVIASWPINGVSGTWPIIVKTFVLNLP